MTKPVKVNTRVPRLASLATCGAAFALLHVAVYVYRAMYYGAALSSPAIIVELLVVCAAGVLGYVLGCLILSRQFKTRTIWFIAIFGYFVSYSISNLLGSTIPSPWLFVVSMVVVTMFVTVKIGPRWEHERDQP